MRTLNKIVGILSGLCLCLCLSYTYSTAQISVFNKVFDNNNYYDAGDNIFKHSSGDYFVYSQSFDLMGYFSIIVFKIDKNGNEIWQKEFDVSVGAEHGWSSLEKNNGNIIVYGSAYDSTEGAGDSHIFEMDTSGNMLWYKMIDAGRNDVGTDIRMENGSYLSTGYFFTDTTKTKSHIYLIKTDSAGNKLWQRDYGTVSADGDYHFAYSMDFTPDGGLIIGGETTVGSAGESDPALYKLDSNYNLEWIKRYGYADNEEYNYAIVTQDSGYALTTYAYDNGDLQGYVVKTDADGNVEWKKYLGRGTELDRFYRIKQLESGNYIVGGQTRNYDLNPTAPISWLLKLKPNGDTLWTRTYRYYETNNSAIHHYFTDMTLCKDGGIAFTGYTINNTVPSKNDVWVVKTDSCGYTDGNSIQPEASALIGSQNQNSIQFVNTAISTSYCTTKWYFGDGDSSHARSPQHTYTDTGTYTAILYTYAGNKWDSAHLKVAITNVGIKDLSANDQLHLYPNPATEQLTISHDYKGKDLTIIFYDIAGKKVAAYPLKNKAKEINLSEWESGVYYYSVQGEQGVLKKGKLAKQ